MNEERSASVDLAWLVIGFVTLMGFLIDPADAQNKEAGMSPRPWVSEPSPALAASLQRWQINFEPGKPAHRDILSELRHLGRDDLRDGLGLLGDFGNKGFCHGVLLVNSMVAKRR